MDTRNKAILVVLAAIMIMSVFFAVISLSEHRRDYREMINSRKTSLEYIINTEFKRLSEAYLPRLRGFVRSNTDVMNAFIQRDRQALISSAGKRYRVLTSESPDFYDIRFFLPDGTLFLSMRDTDSYGMNMSAHSYMAALQGPAQEIQGFTISGDRLVFHTAAEVNQSGETAGFIEFLLKTDKLNETINGVLGTEYAVAVTNRYISDHADIRETILLDKSEGMIKRLPRDIDLSKYSIIESEGRRLLISSNPIKNFKGEDIGHYLTSTDITVFRKRFISFIFFIIIVSAVLLVICAAVLYTGFGSILRRIETMNANLENSVEARTRELNEAKEKAEEQSRIIGSMYRRFKTMFREHHSIMFLISLSDGNIVDANDAGINYLNMDKKTILRKSIADFSLLPEEDTMNILRRAEHHGLKNYVTKLRFSGRVADMEIQASPIEIEGQKLLFVICHDITEKVRMENELKDLNKYLEKRIAEESEKRRNQEQLLIQQSKMSSVGEILSAVIHQWKQPMTALSYLMQDISDAAERDGISKDYIRNISGEALAQINYMTQTVEDFRDFLMPGKKPEEFNIAENIIITIKMLAKQLEKECIDMNLTIINSATETASFKINELSLSPSADFGCFTCSGYPNEFKQVLMNIINNARDAIKSRQQTVDFSGQINIVAKCGTDTVDISIADNAGGIENSIIDKIFDPYFTTKSTKGTGIGLYMAKSIIEDHMGGSLSAGNWEKGALFSISLKMNG